MDCGGHISLSGASVWSGEITVLNLSVAPKDDPHPIPGSARGALRATRHGGSSIIGDAAFSG